MSSESQDEVQSQVQTPVQTPKIKRSKAPLDFRILYCHLSTPPPPPTVNFSGTSRGPTPKCYTFLESSHDPRLGSKLRGKNFAPNSKLKTQNSKLREFENTNLNLCSLLIILNMAEITGVFLVLINKFLRCNIE